MSTTPPEYPQHEQYGQAQQYAPQPQQPIAYPTGYAEQKPLPTNTTVKDTNTYALVAIIITFMVPIAGIIFGHMGLNQIKRTGDAGRGLALTALIYGYSVAALGLIFFVSYIGIIFMVIGTAANMGSYS